MSKMETVSHDGPTLRQPDYGPRSRRCADHLLPTHAHVHSYKKNKTPRLTAPHFTYVSFAPSRRVCVISFFLSEMQYLSEPHGGTSQPADDHGALQGADEQQDELSWAVLSSCLPLISPSSGSCLPAVH